MKKKTIICFGMIFVIILMLVNIRYNNRINNKTITIDNINYLLSLDGNSIRQLPTSGSYYLTSYSCDNGTVLSWDRSTNSLTVNKKDAKVDNCTLEFNTNPLLNTMKVGDYVAYEGNNGCSDNACLGYNAHQSSDNSNYTYGYCYYSGYKFLVYGWRIAYIEDGKVNLISAGAPECLSRNSEDSDTTFVSNMDDVALKYCNTTFIDSGTCSSSNVRAIGEEEFNNITFAISGTASNLRFTSPACYQTGSQKRCGYNNDLIDNGGVYWFASTYIDSEMYGMVWDPEKRIVYQGGKMTVPADSAGVRPIIKLSSSVYVTGGSGTMSDPYTIGI